MRADLDEVLSQSQSRDYPGPSLDQGKLVLGPTTTYLIS